MDPAGRPTGSTGLGGSSRDRQRMGHYPQLPGIQERWRLAGVLKSESPYSRTFRRKALCYLSIPPPPRLSSCHGRSAGQRLPGATAQGQSLPFPGQNLPSGTCSAASGSVLWSSCPQPPWEPGPRLLCRVAGSMRAGEGPGVPPRCTPRGAWGVSLLSFTRSVFLKIFVCSQGPPP